MFEIERVCKTGRIRIDCCAVKVRFYRAKLPVLNRDSFYSRPRYEPEGKLYLERRVGRKMTGKFAGRSLLAYPYKQQSGKCAHCRQPITEAAGWDR
jgi:hypothetical protein